MRAQHVLNYHLIQYTRVLHNLNKIKYRQTLIFIQTDFGSSPVIQQQPYPVQTSVQIIGGNGQASVQTLPPHGQLAAVQAEVHVGMTCPTCNHTRT